MRRIITFLILLHKVLADCKNTCKNSDCPCECYHKEIQCSNRSVTVVPIYPDQMKIQILDLHNNYITKITTQSFNQKCLKNVVGLRLSSNKIKKIPPHAFNGLAKMEMLFLNHNHITDIKENGFASLGNLRRLYLNNNQLKVLRINTFTPLKKSLRLLYIHGNQIEHIPARLLENFQKLKTIDLSQNKITRMDGRYFATLPLLEHIIFKNNPWSCDKGTVCSTFGTFRQIRNRRYLQKLATRHSSAGSEIHSKIPRSLSIYGNMVCKTPTNLIGDTAANVIKHLTCKDVNFTDYFKKLVVYDTYGTAIQNGTENHAQNIHFSPNLIFFGFVMSIILFH